MQFLKQQFALAGKIVVTAIFTAIIVAAGIAGLAGLGAVAERLSSVSQLERNVHRLEAEHRQLRERVETQKRPAYFEKTSVGDARLAERITHDVLRDAAKAMRDKRD